MSRFHRSGPRHAYIASQQAPAHRAYWTAELTSGTVEAVLTTQAHPYVTFVTLLGVSCRFSVALATSPGNAQD
jgi:hypothetical protein